MHFTLTPENILSDDPGDDMQLRLRYQATYAASLSLSLLSKESELDYLFCEHHEDILIKRKDGRFTGVQVKTQASGKPFTATSEPILHSLRRFVELEIQFSNLFHSYILATNCGLGKKNKSRNNLPYILDLVRSSDYSLSSPSKGELAFFINKLNENNTYPPEIVIESLKKIKIPSKNLDLNYAKYSLIHELSILPGVMETEYKKLQEAAGILTYRMFGAASLEFSLPQPLYFSLLGNCEEEAKAAIEGKKITADLVLKTIQEFVSFNLPKIEDGAGLRPPNNIPRSGAIKFVGREEKLEEIHRKILDKKNYVISVVGMGGSGKTELLIRYSLKHLHLQSYPGGIIWLYPKRENISLQILEFSKLNLKNFKFPEGLSLASQIDYCWQNLSRSETLIVIDNVTDFNEVKPYLPPQSLPHYNIILTSREKLGTSLIRVDLGILKPRDSFELLKSLVTEDRVRNEPWVAKNLCKWLGHLPLGLELIGRYLAAVEDLSLTDMLQRLRRKSIRDISLEKADVMMTAQLGIEAAFELSWEILDSNTQELACLLSLFSLAPMPWYLIEDIAVSYCLPTVFLEELSIQALSGNQSRHEISEEDLIQNLKESFEFSRSTLLRLHLLKQTEKNTYRLHQLVREFLKGKLEESIQSLNLKRIVIEITSKIAEKTPALLTQEDSSEVSTLIPHFEEISRTLFEFFEENEVVNLFSGIIRFYHGQEIFKICESWCRFYLEKASLRWSSSYPLLAIIEYQLGVSLHKQGKYIEAESLYLKALEVFEGNASDKKSIASITDRIGILYVDLQRHKKAELFLMNALEIRKSILKERELNVRNLLEYADSLNSLGWFYTDLGRYDMAESFLFEAFDIRSKHLSEDHPFIATSIDNIGVFYLKQGEFEKVEDLYLKAIEIKQNSLGDNHPSIVASIYNLVDFYMRTLQLDKAEKLSNKALKISRKLGVDHPNNIVGREMLKSISFLRSLSSEALEEISEIAATWGIRIDTIQRKDDCENAKGEKAKPLSGGKGFQSKGKEAFEQKRRAKKPSASIIEGGESDHLYCPWFYQKLLPVPRKIFSQFQHLIQKTAIDGYKEHGKGIVFIEIQDSYDIMKFGYIDERECVAASQRSSNDIWEETLLYLKIYAPQNYYIAFISDPLENPGSINCYCYMLPLS